MADSEVNLAIASLTFSILSFLVMVIGLVMIFYPGLRQTLQSSLSGVSSTGSGVLDNLKIAGVLGGAISPDIVLLIGFISDLMNLKFRYSVTSLIGIFAVILHWIIGGALFGFSKGATSAVASVASALTTAVATGPTIPSAPPASPQEFGVGDPTAPPVLATPRGGPILGAISRPNRQAINRQIVEARAGIPAAAAAVGRTKEATLKKTGRATGNPDDVSTLGSSTMGNKTRVSSDERAKEEAARITSGIMGPTGTRKTREPKVKQQGGVLPDYITQKFNPCAIRGLGFFDIQGSPMGMAALSAIFMVYLLDMTVGNKRSTPQVGGYLGFSFAVFFLNVFAYRELKCVDTTSVATSLKALGLPLSVGLLSGTIGYYVLKNNYANFLPLDGTHFDDGTGGGNTPATGNNQPHCSAPDDENQMVCDAYQNGKKITSVPVT
jgi:hypothetical protein